MNKIEPKLDWLLVELDKPEEKEGSIILMPSDENNKFTGTVVAVGPGKYNSKGGRNRVGVEVGEKVAFLRWHLEHKTGKSIRSLLGGLEIESVKGELGLIREPDVLFAFDKNDKVSVS